MTTRDSSHTILPTQRVLSACLVIGEPQLEEILAEPIVLLRMRSTGLSVEEVRTLCECARDRLSAEPPEANVPMVGRM
jgi:hypothetical protein